MQKSIMVPNHILFMHSYQLWIRGIQRALRSEIFTTLEVFQAGESLNNKLEIHFHHLFIIEYLKWYAVIHWRHAFNLEHSSVKQV